MVGAVLAAPAALAIDHQPALGVAARVQPELLAFHRAEILRLQHVAVVVDVRQGLRLRRVVGDEVVDVLDEALGPVGHDMHGLEVGRPAMGHEDQVGPDPPDVPVVDLLVGAELVGQRPLLAADHLGVAAGDVGRPVLALDDVEGRFEVRVLAHDLRMQVRAVVALHLVEGELPVGLDVVAVAPEVVEPVVAGHDAPELLDDAAAHLGQRRTVGRQVDEHHVAEPLDPDLAQGEILKPEAGDVLGVARRPQRARGVVGPGVEGAGEDRLVALALGQHVAAVHADIVERAQAPVLAAAHQDLLVEQVGGEIVARLRQIPGVADELPGLEPDLLDLAGVDFGIEIVAAGQRRRPLGVGMKKALLG